MRLAFLSASASMLAVCAAPALSAQLASEIAALHHDGQTFVTWRESSKLGVRYRVYRSPVPILGEAELGAADYLGEVDDKSSRNKERSQVERAERYWVIAEGGARSRRMATPRSRRAGRDRSRRFPARACASR